MKNAVDFLEERIDSNAFIKEQLALQARAPRAIRVQERIDHGWEVYDDIELTPWNRLRSEFILPLHRAALNRLELEGLKALRSPLVLWGSIGKRNPSGSYSHDWSHVLRLEWLDLGSNATGFYLEVEGGKTIDFPKAIDPGEGYFSELIKNKDPTRRDFFYFSQTVDAPEENIFRLSPELYRTITEEQKILQAGLILKDGSKTDPGLVAYVSDYAVGVQESEEKPSNDHFRGLLEALEEPKQDQRTNSDARLLRILKSYESPPFLEDIGNDPVLSLIESLEKLNNEEPTSEESADEE